MNFLSRRSFLNRWIAAIWSTITAAVTVPAVGYLSSPLLVKETLGNEDWHDIGEAAAFETNVPRQVVFNAKTSDGFLVRQSPESAWVVRKSESELVVFSPRCTHLGCAYACNEEWKEFACPCHASVFSLDGSVLQGPAPRPLDRYAHKVEDGRLLIQVLNT